MTDNKEVMAWADELAKQAFTEARGGNTNLLNRLAANTAMKLYVDNVHGTKTVPANQFPAYYAPQWKEITHLYEEYKREETVTEAVDKVAALESKFDTFAAQITAQLAALLEAQKPVVEAVEPKKGKKAAKAEEVVEEAEADESAESEA